MKHLKELKDKIALSSQRNRCLLAKLQCGFIRSRLYSDGIRFLSLSRTTEWFESCPWILISRHNSLLKTCSPALQHGECRGVVSSGCQIFSCPCLWHVVRRAVMCPRGRTPGDGAVLPENLMVVGMGKVQKSLEIMRWM